MKSWIEILVLTTIIIVVASLMGVIKPWWVALISVAIICLVIYMLTKYKGAAQSSDNTDLQNQIKFYDFLLKAITLIIALSAIFLYKDRQEMKTRLDTDYSDMKQRLEKEISSTLSSSETIIKELKATMEEAQILSYQIKATTKNAGVEYGKLKQLQENWSVIVHSQKRYFDKQPFNVGMKYSAGDSTSSIINDKWYNDNAVDFYLSGCSETQVKSMLSKALKLNNKNKEALFNLGFMYYIGQDYDQAITIVDEYSKYYPYDGEIYICKAQCLIQMKKNKEAFENIKKAIDLGWKDYSLIYKSFCGQDSSFIQLVPEELR